MVKAKRTQKLKVFRTPIGFHDAYVAAPSQKAALEAWGAATNLFSQGSAEVVTDPKLAEIPLAHPGQVVKVLRGSRKEQLAALSGQLSAKQSKSRGTDAEVIPRKRKPRKPSRAKLDKAEKALRDLELQQANKREALERRLQQLEMELKSLKRDQEREGGEAAEKAAAARSEYEQAMREYESS